MAVDVVARALAIKAQQGGGPGGSDYATLTNKPSINGVTLEGNKTSSDLGIEQPIYWDGEIDENGNALAMFQKAYDYYLETGEITSIIFKKTENNGEINFLPLVNMYLNQNGTEVDFVFASISYIPNSYTDPTLLYRNYRFHINNGVLSFWSYVSFDAFSFEIAHVWDGTNTAYGGCLDINNTIAYTPTGDYNPATKQYVDSSVTNQATTEETISGLKTFTTLPESSVVPTADNQLVNKQYVDSTLSTTLGNINTILATLTTVSEVSE